MAPHTPPTFGAPRETRGAPLNGSHLRRQRHLDAFRAQPLEQALAQLVLDVNWSTKLATWQVSVNSSA